MEYTLSKVTELQTKIWLQKRISAMGGIFQNNLSIENFRANASFSCAL